MDKLRLNNLIQDNTYMKDYLVYCLMMKYGVKFLLRYSAKIRMNGKDFGLYLVVEGLESEMGGSWESIVWG